LTEIPDRKGIPKNHATSMYARYRYAQKHGMDGLVLVGQKTLSTTYHGCMNAFLEWARTKTDWVPPAFVFNQASADAPEAEPRDAFTDEELLRFFSLPLFTGCESATHIWIPGTCFVQDATYWGYVIHVLMGLRPSEIAKLLTSDLVQIGDEWYIDMRRKRAKADEKEPNRKKRRRLKSAAAYRMVPVPRLIIDLGLAERKAALEATGETRLFPDWPIYMHTSGREMPGHFLSKSWQYVKVKFKFTREFLTLYSGRHTLASWYDAMNLPQRIRDRLLGHTPQDVPGNYGAIDLTPDEMRLVRTHELAIQVAIADVLLTAKLKAEYEKLTPVPFVRVRRRP